MDDATAGDQRSTSHLVATEPHVLALTCRWKRRPLAFNDVRDAAGPVDCERVVFFVRSAVECVQRVAAQQFRRELAPGYRCVEIHCCSFAVSPLSEAAGAL